MNLQPLFDLFLIPIIPALTHSAINVAVYNDKAAVKAISSGGILNPPRKP